MADMGGYRPSRLHAPRAPRERPAGAGKKMGLFKKEGDVRDWVRGRTKDPFWIEPTRGSTIGVPDTFVHDAGGVWIELKHGVCKDRILLKWKPRPGQYGKIRTLRDRGSRVGVLIGFGNSLFVVTDPEIFKRGWAEIPPGGAIDGRDAEAWGKVLESIAGKAATEKDPTTEEKRA